MPLQAGDPVIWFRMQSPQAKIPAIYLGKCKKKGASRVRIRYTDRISGKEIESNVSEDLIEVPRPESPRTGADLHLAGPVFGHIR